MQFQQADTDRHLFAETRISTFLEKASFSSLTELKAVMRDSFLGTGSLSAMTTQETVQILRLRIEPQSGGEFTIVIQDEGDQGIHIRFWGLPTNRADYANQLWAFHLKSAGCPKGPLSESVHFSGFLAHELRRKLKTMALLGLRKPVPTQFDTHIKKHFFASLEMKTPRRENSISFSSHEAHLDPICDHMDVVEWIVGSTQKILATSVAKERLESFHHGYLVSSAPAA